MKNSILMLPLAGALLGLALSYLAFLVKFRMVAKTAGYSRKSYKLIESFDLKEAVFITLTQLLMIMAGATGYPMLKGFWSKAPEPDGIKAIIPIPRDSLIKLIPPPPPIDPRNNVISEPLPGVVKSPTFGRLVVVLNDLVLEPDDLTNHQVLNYYARQNGLPDTLIGKVVIDTIENLPDPGSFVNHDKLPVPLNAIRPVYPSICQELNVEGKVIMNVLVDKNGCVARVLVLRSSGNEALDAAAAEALKEARFSPAIQGDKPVAVWLSYPVTFRLD